MCSPSESFALTWLLTTCLSWSFCAMQPLPGAHHKTDTPWHLTICNGAAILDGDKSGALSGWLCLEWSPSWLPGPILYRSHHLDLDDMDNDADDEDKDHDTWESRGCEDMIASARRPQQREEKHIKCLKAARHSTADIWQNKYDI